MKKLNPFEIFLWTFRRKEKDVVNLYDKLSDLMQIATGGDMLNFGYWDSETKTPLDAQKQMCTIFGKKAQLDSNQDILDVGSGLGSPSIQWSEEYSGIKSSCININYSQLHSSTIKAKNEIPKNSKNLSFVNATAPTLPFTNASVDRILSLEAAQHFKPLKNFISESHRILKNNGMLALAIPVMVDDDSNSIKNLGSLSFTWSSEHYSKDFLKSTLEEEQFEIKTLENIGNNVYQPLANYYIENREKIKEKILKKYPSYVEKILFRSLNKMKEVSEKKIIDYLLVTCIKK